MVADKVDLSLDEIIASNKKSRGGRSRGRGAGSGRGGTSRRGGAGGPIRNTRGGRERTIPYRRPKSIPERWEHDMFDGSSSRGRSNIGSSDGLVTGTHLQISNLDFGVTESDIKELFSEFGNLKKVRINYDESGRSHGTADVFFERKPDALKALKTYNEVPLDGRPMKIVAVSGGASFEKPFTSPGRRGSGFRGSYQQNRRGSNRGALNRGGGRMRRGRGGREAPPNREQLDKELDSYIEEKCEL